MPFTKPPPEEDDGAEDGDTVLPADDGCDPSWVPDDPGERLPDGTRADRPAHDWTADAGATSPTLITLHDSCSEEEDTEEGILSSSRLTLLPLSLV